MRIIHWFGGTTKDKKEAQAQAQGRAGRKEGRRLGEHNLISRIDPLLFLSPLPVFYFFSFLCFHISIFPFPISDFRFPSLHSCMHGCKAARRQGKAACDSFACLFLSLVDVKGYLPLVGCFFLLLFLHIVLYFILFCYLFVVHSFILKRSVTLPNTQPGQAKRKRNKRKRDSSDDCMQLELSIQSITCPILSYSPSLSCSWRMLTFLVHCPFPRLTFPGEIPVCRVCILVLQPPPPRDMIGWMCPSRLAP